MTSYRFWPHFVALVDLLSAALLWCQRRPHYFLPKFPKFRWWIQNLQTPKCFWKVPLCCKRWNLISATRSQLRSTQMRMKLKWVILETLHQLPYQRKNAEKPMAIYQHFSFDGMGMANSKIPEKNMSKWKSFYKTIRN